MENLPIKSCQKHPNKVIKYQCSICGKLLCVECKPITYAGKIFCSNCISKAEEQAKSDIFDLEFFDIFKTMLRYPITIIKLIASKGDAPFIYQLAFMIGAVNVLSNIHNKIHLGGQIPFFFYVLTFFSLIISAVIGGLGGIITIFINGWLFRIGSKIMGGDCTAKEIRAIFAYSAIPGGISISTLAIPLSISNIFFKYFFPNILIVVIVASGGLWSFYLFVYGVKMLNRFSFFRALCAVLVLPIALTLVVLGCLLLLGKLLQ